MSDPFARLHRFLVELRRRKVYRVAATYAVVGPSPPALGGAHRREG